MILPKSTKNGLNRTNSHGIFQIYSLKFSFITLPIQFLHPLSNLLLVVIVQFFQKP